MVIGVIERSPWGAAANPAIVRLTEIMQAWCLKNHYVTLMRFTGNRQQLFEPKSRG
jgi:hypothetical protein